MASSFYINELQARGWTVYPFDGGGPSFEKSFGAWQGHLNIGTIDAHPIIEAWGYAG